MRDIPVFTTEHGAAGLVLREIPYKKTAYITIHSSMEPKEFLQECVEFCKMCGAEKIYATGHEMLQNFPFHTAVWKMCRTRCDLPNIDARLQAVSEGTLGQWRRIYNERMENVPNGAFMSGTEAEKYMQEGTAWFVYREDALAGIGIAAEDTVKSVIAMLPGAGEMVLCALCSTLQSEFVRLEVASANLPAMRLYKRLGFEKTAELSCWYDVTK